MIRGPRSHYRGNLIRQVVLYASIESTELPGIFGLKINLLLLLLLFTGHHKPLDSLSTLIITH